MKISVFGTGYVGLIVGTCLADLGNEVTCVDIDENKINNLKKGILPIYEPGLRDLVERNAKEERLFFTTEAKESIENAQIIFIAVGTPSGKNQEANLQYVFDVAKSIGAHMNGYKVIVDKSTVPVGTADKVKQIIKKNQKKEMEYDVVSNPEFLREGEAIGDFMNPDRVVIGAETDKAKELMLKLYRPIERTGKPILTTDVKSAEMIKYASNAMLATRISFMNQLAPLCEKMGADVKFVAKGMGLDRRIGPRFLQAGVGYGGSCFPKDVNALVQTLKQNDCHSELLDAVETINYRQKQHLLSKVKKLLGEDLKNKKIAVWGLAFKPKTDDMREAPSIVVIEQLQKEGAKVVAFDPVAQEAAKKILKDIEYASNPYKALQDADCLIIVTEWNEFRELDKEKIKSLMNTPNIVDGRNVYNPADMKQSGFNYVGVGR